MSDKSLYDILGVRADASQAEIRAAYLKLAKQWHPDRNAGNEAEAERRFKEIAHAYGVLSDPDKRAAYDAARGANQQSSASDGSMDDDAAFDLFISVLLDLAFELAASGADQIAIYQALIDMGCPSGTAKTLAQRAHKLGGTGNPSGSRWRSTKPQSDWHGVKGCGSSNGGPESTNAEAIKPDDPDATFPAGPWSRWFARSLDLFVGAAIASPVIGLLGRWLWTLDPAARLAAYIFLVTPIPFIVDTIIVGMFGNSLGKALLKISVVTKATVDGEEKLRPIGPDDALLRNFEIWFKGFWLCLPFAAAIPQFLAYLNVSEGKQVPWDMGPHHQGVQSSCVDDSSSQPSTQKQKFFVQRQKARWELIAAFVLCLVVLPAITKFGAELFAGPWTVGARGPDVAASSEAAAEANLDRSKPAVEFNRSNNVLNQAEITFETIPSGGVVVINGQEYASGSKLLYNLSSDNIRDGFVNVMGGFAYWQDGRQSRQYKIISAYFDRYLKGKYVFLQDVPRNSEFRDLNNFSNVIAGGNIAKKPSLGTRESFVEPDVEAWRNENETKKSGLAYDFSGTWTGLGQDEGMSWDINIQVDEVSYGRTFIGRSSYTNHDAFSAGCASNISLIAANDDHLAISENKINPLTVGCIGSPAGKNIVISRSENGKWFGVWSKKSGNKKVTMVAYLDHKK